MDPSNASAVNLFAPLVEAIGGTERILTVRTFLREAVHRSVRGGREGNRTRVLTYRAAGGRLRIETRILRSPSPPVADPSAAPEPPIEDDVVLASSDGVTMERARAALRQASLEPRNLLAHVHERPHSIRRSPDDATEIELTEAGVLYRFDAATGLCAWRWDDRARTVTSYLDWTVVGGVATPMREMWRRFAEPPAPESIEEIVLTGVAYDLPLPDDLFRK